ncbi:MAG: type II toxin-antitoxin system Phd/YefM family antitoxin [Acidimicrobiales bacterium]
MATVSIRELRNHGGAVVERVRRGERIIITSDGTPVAELHPLHPSGPSAETLVERRRHLPRVDPAQLREEADAVIGARL